MKNWGLMIVALTLGACGKPEAKACENFIKEGLKSPSSYRLVETDVRDQKLSDSEWGSIKAKNPMLRSLKKPANKGHRIVTIKYDAQNGFGATIREAQACRFATIDGETESASRLNASVEIANGQRSFRSYVRSGGVTGVAPDEFGPEPEYPCCS